MVRFMLQKGIIDANNRLFIFDFGAEAFLKGGPSTCITTEDVDATTTERSIT
jgi:hypothetical protein